MLPDVYSLARMVHSIAKLPIDQRAMAAPTILKHTLELPNTEERSLIYILLGTTLSSRPNVTLNTAREWARGLEKERAHAQASEEGGS